MNSDIFSQFGQTAAGKGAAVPPKLPGEYTAFGTKDKNLRLRIRAASGLTHAPSYTFLTDIVYDGPEGTNFILSYNVITVLVQGRNLQKIVFAIENALADFIQEFDGNRWQKPADAGAAFIESIKVKVNEGALAAAEAKS